ncbi:MAG: MerR family transcriptional regulator [Clostridia bacterium]|nr:MerR family transcriptional regulator [Clostridia bacterium]
MMTVHEVSQKTGVSIRALHHYDSIGLLCPAAVSEAGYRLYDDAALERLQQILLFRELEFPLKDIAAILDSPNFDRGRALEQQIMLLELRREHLDRLLAMARDIQEKGVNTMQFEAFSTDKIDAYAEQAKRTWGNTEAYREYEEKSRGRQKKDNDLLAEGLMQIFASFGRLKNLPTDAPEVKKTVEELQNYITAHYYTCTPEILKGLGQLYGAGGEMTENIDQHAGTGTAAFAAEAIAGYCK